ncbi:hypothetical protein GW17_00036639 [Ensete ventricosum]|nr:hypothetical protein GW17_00036639 [Ensete ventricosum]
MPTFCRYRYDSGRYAQCVSDKALTPRYVPVRQLTGTQTYHYRAVLLKSAVSDRFRPSIVDFGRRRSIKGEIDRRRSIEEEIDRRRSIEEEIDRRRSIEEEIDRRRSIEEEKGKRKKRKTRKKKRRRRNTSPVRPSCPRVTRAPSPPAGRPRALTARGRLFSPRGERDRGDQKSSFDQGLPFY